MKKSKTIFALSNRELVGLIPRRTAFNQALDLQQKRSRFVENEDDYKSVKSNYKTVTE